MDGLDTRRQFVHGGSSRQRTWELSMSALTNKVAVITGAAGVIGTETINVFKSQGAVVVGVDLAGTHENADVFLHADLTNEAEVERLYASAYGECGRIDILFNNAGIADVDDSSVLNSPIKVWNRVLAANLTSVFLCCKHGIPYLLNGGGGSVVNTASLVAGMGSAVSQIGYTASKGGVLSMSREMGVEFAKQGVRVNAISPGPVETPLLKNMFSAEDATRRLVHVPMGRFANPREVAEVVAFLCSDAASYVNASEINIDGGIKAAYVTPV